jgi:hypothetical protein
MKHIIAVSITGQCLISSTEFTVPISVAWDIEMTQAGCDVQNQTMHMFFNSSGLILLSGSIIRRTLSNFSGLTRITLYVSSTGCQYGFTIWQLRPDPALAPYC